MNLNFESHRPQRSVAVDESSVHAATPVYEVSVIRSHREPASSDECCDSPIAMPTELEARTRRARVVGEMIAAGIMAVVAFVSRAHASYRRRREAAGAYAALTRFDDRALLDLGFTRDEIKSVIAESMGGAERTRVRARAA